MKVKGEITIEKKKYYDTYKDMLKNLKGGEYGGHDGIGWYIKEMP